MKLNRLDIKIHSPLTKYNLGYTPKAPTDEELYTYWGIKEKGLRADVCSNNGKLKKFKSFKVKDYIEYAEKHCDPILPDEEEFIPRKYWAPIDELIGEDLGVLYHPIWGLTRQIINETYVKHSDTLLIQDCSNKKPYIHNANYRTSLILHYAGYCDLAVNSIELIPISYTIYYPFRMYDWAHLNETPFMSQALSDFNFDRIVSFVQRFNYKRVILLTKPMNGEGKETELATRLRDMYKNSDVEFINIYDEDYFKKQLKRAKRWALLKNHYHGFAKEKLYDIFGIDVKSKPTSLYSPEDYIRKDKYDFNSIVKLNNYTPPKPMEDIVKDIDSGESKSKDGYSKRRIKSNTPLNNNQDKDKVFGQIKVDKILFKRIDSKLNLFSKYIADE